MLADDVFKPRPSRPATKSDITNQAARSIIDKETAQRAAKTERLRKARLEQEAKIAADSPPPAGPRARKAKTVGRRARGA